MQARLVQRPPHFKCQNPERLLLFDLAPSTGLLFCLMSVLLPQGKDEKNITGSFNTEPQQLDFLIKLEP